MHPAPGLRALHARPTLALVWAGQVMSVLGDRLYSVALVWVTLQLTHSPSAVAWVSIADTAPFLAVSLLSGWIGDRTDGLRLTRFVDLTRAATVAIIPVLYATHHLNVVALAGVAAALSVQEAFFVPALQASVPRLVEPTGLTPMVSLLDSTDRLGRVLGPGLIGLVAALPEVHLFTIDAVTFLISAACLTAVLRRVPASTASRETASERSVLQDLLLGWRWTFGRTELRNALVLRGICNVAWPAFTVLVPFVINERFGQGIGGFGLALGLFGAGNLIGTVFAARVPRSWLGRTCCVAWLGAGVGFAGLAIASNYGVFLATTTAIGVCTPLANVTVNAQIAATAPRDVLARVYTAQRVTVVAASVVGLPAVAALSTARGSAFTLLVAGGLMAAAGGAALISAARQSPR